MAQESPKLAFWPVAVSMVIAMFVQGAYYSYISLAIFFDFAGGNLFIVSLVEMVPLLAIPIVIFWIGKYADVRQNHKQLFLVSLGALSVGNISFLLVYTFARNPYLFMVVLFPVSILFGIVFSNGPAYVSLVRPTQKGRYMGLLLFYQSVGAFLGSTLGGVFFVQWGIEVLFWLGILLPLGGIAVIAAFLPRVSEAPQKGKTPVLEKFHPLANPVLRVGLLFDFTLMLGIGLFYKFFGIFYVQDLQGPAEFVGLAGGLASLLGALAGFGFGTLADKKSPLIVLIYGWAGYLVVFLGLFFQRNPISAVIFWALPIYVEFIGLNKIVAEMTSESTRNRGISISTISRYLGSAIGVLGGGILSLWFPLDLILVVTLGSFAPSLIFLVLTCIRYKNRSS